MKQIEYLIQIFNASRPTSHMYLITEDDNSIMRVCAAICIYDRSITRISIRGYYCFYSKTSQSMDVGAYLFMHDVIVAANQIMLEKL